MRKSNFIKAGVLLFAMSLIVFSSCKKKEPAPDIPSTSSMVMDFSQFSSSDDTTATRDTSTYHNWGYSFANVAVWNTIITVGLALPVAAYRESFNHEAEYDSHAKTWTWSYSFGLGHQAQLVSYFKGDTVVWEMTIDDFQWYYGHSHVDKSGGYWILNESKTQQRQLLRIDWHQNSDGTFNISYTNVAPATSSYGDENGGYISYGVTTGEFDRFYHIYNKGEDNLTEIEWQKADRHGHVKDPKEFGDSDWHCWNTNLADITCQ